ncbi:unnamed protein product [Rotaria magnacalcarata]|uniref:Protein-tyrosine sulfotransferase n=1 Tax=Rotaria magnacalcarata TaxID=392030 RepID=A0A816NND1_9BILA|nr:unnamed protein product [Rotaria magnacalcarata]CAF1245949.1 unnamed protein product [Rotaria magnacalcarata]CAF2037309.1 unnamed protein product [Rotaria magnacalcarata]CAF2240649.1 unnamed protein product [Rotaria magnacalcarata]CAF2265304.1 unnamed protein product [Rotaria magnacalcarata]
MPWYFMCRRILFNIPHRTIRSRCFFITILLVTIIIVILLAYRLSNIPQECLLEHNSFRKQNDINHNSSLERPVIFIGGMPRSGTTLMRAILDSHPLVRCGEETRVIPRLLNMRAAWEKSTLEWNRLMAGGISKAMIDSAVRAFVYEILLHHNQYADVLCDKDPFVLKYAAYISSIFSNAKFLLLIRDARAVIHSVMTRKVTITGFNLLDYRQNFKVWNKGMETMMDQCTQVGKDKCLPVYYEQLVLQPKNVIENILKFLNLTWVDSVLHHEELIGKKISLSKTEHSSDQVIKPINLDALTRWIGHIPSDVKSEIDTLAPMLKRLGYDTQSDVPTYGTPDQLVLDNMNKLKENAEFWDSKAKFYARRAPNDTRIFQNDTKHQPIL